MTLNSVWVECPKCGELAEFKSSAGRCNRANYHSARYVPSAIVAALNGAQLHCAVCNQLLTLRRVSRATDTQMAVR